MNNHDFIGFVPYQLEIAGKPELNDFPLNVLFASRTVRNGVRVMGTALYEPDFATLKQNGVELSMKYRNKYGGDCWLKITHNAGEGIKYHGEKFMNGKLVGMADGGNNWDMFFVHFTMLGLANGERCEFEEVD